MKKIDQLIEELSDKFKEKQYSLVTAESCTGGGLAYFIIKNPRCSSILERGYIVYSINSKEDVLEVSSYTLQTFGAVSKEAAKEMAEQSLKKSASQISIAITGMDEDSAIEKGLAKSGHVWISCAGIDKNTIMKQIYVKGGRATFCETTIFESLKILLDFIKDD